MDINTLKPLAVVKSTDKYLVIDRHIQHLVREDSGKRYQILELKTKNRGAYVSIFASTPESVEAEYNSDDFENKFYQD